MRRVASAASAGPIAGAARYRDFAPVNRSRVFTLESKMIGRPDPATLRSGLPFRKKGLPMKRTIVLWAILFAVSPGFAYKTRVDFDHGTQFSCYKTYSWEDSAGASQQESLFPNQLMRQRIAGFIEEALSARGFKRVPKGGDLSISYQVKVTEEPVFTTFSNGFGPGWGWDSGWGNGWGGGWGSGISTTTVQTFYEGTLVIDIVDANHKKLVFQGTSTHDISSRPDRNSKRLSRAVNEIFEKYPPQP
jgi:hypothetical protein